MGDANPICTLGDYSKPSHEGYRNTIELPVGNNVDPNQHIKDFLKVVDSLDLDGENRERACMSLFQFSLHDQARNWLERLPTGSITTWEDLTTRFLAQFFPPGRTVKLRNDILMFQQHQGESLSEARTCFKDLLQKCEIDHAAGGKIRNKNPDESWEIIENLAFYDHEGWNDAKEFVKPVKAISTPQPTSKMPDRRLLKLEGQINFLLKGSRPTPKPSSTHVPQAYAEPVYSNPRSHRLGTTFKARVRDYMAAQTKRMERFENEIFKQREEINDRMAEMFGLLKKLTTNRAHEKVLIREEAKSLVTKNVNSISLARWEEERNNDNDVSTSDDIEKPTTTKTGMPVKETEKENEAENEINSRHLIHQFHS
ncbi:MAK10-like protein [Tanacetum coccineum]|uniref:MAK10-like protein n=1 Tax=Tanacetum coccineum TaxID=301880 RepID=A0ABQ5CMY4_9ASTR